RVVRLAAHVLRDAEEAEDAAQDAFIRAFGRLRSYRHEARFFTWLAHIVVRVCLDRQRLARWKRESTNVFIEPGDGRLGTGAEGADLRILVEALLVRLSPPMRAALVLRELEGLEYSEIS